MLELTQSYGSNINGAMPHDYFFALNRLRAF